MAPKGKMAPKSKMAPKNVLMVGEPTSSSSNYKKGSSGNKQFINADFRQLIEISIFPPSLMGWLVLCVNLARIEYPVIYSTQTFI